MYSNSFAVAIKHNGKILRETKDLVHLPFGSEFTVLIKNLNSRRAKFTLHIDGTDVLGGEEIIVNANSEVEMKRFIRNSNMSEGNAFKFIERTAAIEDGPRGIKVDDGIVRIEFWFEQEKPEIKINNIYWDKHHYTNTYHQPQGPFWGSITYGSGTMGSSGNMRGIASIAGDAGATYSATSASVSAPTLGASAVAQNAVYGDVKGTFADKADVFLNEVGITVPGSKVEQTFTPVYGFKSEEQSNVIVIRLAGKKGETEIVAPITVKTKQKCTTCGHVNKSTAKFCSECGTGLEIV